MPITIKNSDRIRIYKRIHYRLRLAEMQDQKEQMVREACQSRTTSMSELSEGELLQLRRTVEITTELKLKKTRGKIIHTLCLLGMVKGEKPDYEAINTWCATRTKAHKELMKQTYSELQATASQVDAWYKRESR